MMSLAALVVGGIFGASLNITPIPTWIAILLAVGLVLLVITPTRISIEEQARLRRVTVDLEHRISEQLAQVNQFAARGRELEDGVRSLGYNWQPILIDEVKRWVQEVYSYFQDNLPEFAERFMSDTIGRELPQPMAHPEVQKLGNYIERRRGQLYLIIDELGKRQPWYRAKASRTDE